MSPASLLADLYARGIRAYVQDGELKIEAPKGSLTETDKLHLKCLKQDIVALLLQAQASHIERNCFTGVDIPLSRIQSTMLVLHSMSGKIPYSNNVYAWDIKGALNVERFIESIAVLVQKHEILHTIYRETNEGKFQELNIGLVSDKASLCPVVKLEGPAENLESLLRKEREHHFDLNHELPFRALLISLSPTQHIFNVCFHQICCDGASATLFFRLLSAQYAAADGNLIETAALQYRDYVGWENKLLGSDEMIRSRRWWQNQLQNAPELHSLATDFVRPPVQRFSGAIFRQFVEGKDLDRLRRYAAAHNMTPFAVLHALFATLVALYSETDDVVVGTVSANRNLPELVSALGCFATTLPIPYRLQSNDSLQRIMENASQVISAALAHQHVSFDEIVTALNPARSFSHNPLVQLMLVWQDQRESDLALPELQISERLNLPDIARFDLTVHVFNTGQGMELRWEYASDLFRQSSIERMAKHFLALLDTALNYPETLFSNIQLEVVNPPAPLAVSNVPPHRIETWIQEIIERFPDRRALVDENGSCTYQELNHLSATLLSRLRFEGSEKQKYVGVFLQKSISWVASILAVFRAGAVYVPLDPDYPSERLQWMIEDACLDAVIVNQPQQQVFVEALGLPAIDVSDLPALLGTKKEIVDSAAYPAATLAVDDIAYVIFTSGSTGRPKGVAVSHRSIWHSLRANHHAMSLCEDDTFPSIGSQAFGISVLEVLLPLTCGASVQILRQAQVRDVDVLIEKTQSSSILHAVPSLMDRWLTRVQERNLEYPNLRLLLVGGEAVPHAILRRLREWRPDVRILELYGMTECAVVCCSYEYTGDFDAHFCIGKPHASAEFWVFNKALKPQVDGLPGELFIGGTCLATGYLHKVEATAEKFIEHPELPGKILYRTGDRVRRLQNGVYEFLGRSDFQISVRGVRIEAGEIESILAKHSGVAKAVVSLVRMESGEDTLVAYIKVKNDILSEESLLEELRKLLARTLPDYMRPGILHCIDAFPLNANGKTDRKKLPVPRVTTRHAEPETDTQRRIVEIWQSLFAIKQIGLDDNYFNLGGNSLLASRIINKTKDAFNIDLPLAAMFESPTVRRLAEIVDEKLMDASLSSLLFEENSKNEFSVEIDI